MLPEKFLERMKRLLGGEYEAFADALEKENVKGIRVNETKIPIEDFLDATELTLSEIGYTPCGFIPEAHEGIGNTPEHHAGMFYVQDPGAMATVCSLDVKQGWRVLDSCSAPGGKASQLSSLIGDEGLLIANEYVAKRAKIIVSNFERLGIKNAMVLSCDTSILKQMFANYFDLVLCDAPCSGEGMFRKYDEALSEWSMENVIASAKRQREILENLAPLVRDGGYLLYSTCTYSAEENEENVSAFLTSHPDYRLVPVREEVERVTASGICGGGLSEEEAQMCRRFYPHLSPGEGQFIALMQRATDGDAKILYKDESQPLSRMEERIVQDFLKENLKTVPEGRLIKQGDFVTLVPHGAPLPRYSVFMSGVMVGEIRKGRFEPHHQLFSAYGRDFKNKENLKRGDGRAFAYLKGEEIEARETGSGYCAILYQGVPIGGGKTSGGRIKNHYPKGLRIRG